MSQTANIILKNIIKISALGTFATASLAASDDAAIVSVQAEGVDCGLAATAPWAVLDDANNLRLRGPLKASARAVLPSTYAWQSVSCTHLVTLQIPAGKRLAVAAVSYPVELSYTLSAGGFHGITVKIAGNTPAVSRMTPGISGTTVYHAVQKFGFEEGSRSHSVCGDEQASLELTLKALVRAQGGNAASLAIGGNEGDVPAIHIELAWEDCDVPAE